MILPVRWFAAGLRATRLAALAAEGGGAMVRLLVAIVIGAVLAAGASFLISSVAGTGAAKPVNQPLYNYGSR